LEPLMLLQYPPTVSATCGTRKIDAKNWYHIAPMKDMLDHTDYKVLASLLIKGIHMGETDWLCMHFLFIL
jgi:hypothetical protein